MRNKRSKLHSGNILELFPDGELSIFRQARPSALRSSTLLGTHLRKYQQQKIRTLFIQINSFQWQEVDVSKKIKVEENEDEIL